MIGSRLISRAARYHLKIKNSQLSTMLTRMTMGKEAALPKAIQMPVSLPPLPMLSVIMGDMMAGTMEKASRTNIIMESIKSEMPARFRLLVRKCMDQGSYWFATNRTIFHDS